MSKRGKNEEQSRWETKMGLFPASPLHPPLSHVFVHPHVSRYPAQMLVTHAHAKKCIHTFQQLVQCSGT